MNANVPRNAPDRARWAELVADIKQGLPAGHAHLYEVFSSGLRVMLGRQVAEPSLSGVMADIFADVVKAIQRGELDRSDDLPSLIRKLARRRVPANAPRLPVAGVEIDGEFEKALRKLRRKQFEALLRIYGGADEQAVCTYQGIAPEALSLLKASLRTEFKRISEARSKFVKRPVLAVAAGHR